MITPPGDRGTSADELAHLRRRILSPAGAKYLDLAEQRLMTLTTHGGNSREFATIDSEATRELHRLAAMGSNAA